LTRAIEGWKRVFFTGGQKDWVLQRKISLFHVRQSPRNIDPHQLQGVAAEIRTPLHCLHYSSKLLYLNPIA
jgi:hypothetical protein